MFLFIILLGVGSIAHLFYLHASVERVLKNPNLVSVQICHSEKVQLFDWLVTIFECQIAKRYKSGKSEYTKDLHRDWCDENNSGVTHFGFHPMYLPRDNIRFDIFHLRSALTRKLMENLRKYIHKQSHETIQKFSVVLLKFWGEYHVSVWRLNKTFSSFNGNEIMAFIRNIKKVVEFMRGNFGSEPEVDAICEGLLAFSEITTFLNIVTYNSEAHYNMTISKFENDVKKFYTVGRSTYLFDKEDGDAETFYCHTVRFYMLRIAKITWEKHRLGLGIYTMQGFERRNKESKNTFRRFTNKKGNTLTQNLKRLWDLFYHENVNI